MADDRSADGAGPSSAPSTAVVLMSGACSGLVARFFTHPLDTVKARLQGGAPLAYAGTADALRQVLRFEGVAGAFRGFSAVAAAVPFASAVYFGGYTLSQRALAADPHARDALGASGTYVAAGVVAQACAGLVYTPQDLVKERLQVQALLPRSGSPLAQPLYRGSADVVRAIIRADGLKGLFRGYWAANAAWWPWNVLYFVTYEHARDAAAVAAGLQGKEELAPMVSASCAAAAAALATLATNPVDVVKTRLQTLPQRPGGGALAVARAMWAAEGAAAFRAGMAARVLSIAPGSFISFFTYEFLLRRATANAAAAAADAAVQEEEAAAGPSALALAAQ